jgi:drug/metabolite transporter (DMT)-like permease
MLGAQLVAALAVDWLVNDDPPTIGVLAGSALVVVAMALVARDRALSPPAAPWQAGPLPPPSGR